MSRPSSKAWLAGLAAPLAACTVASTQPSGDPDSTFPSRRTSYPIGERALGFIANQFDDSVSVVDLDSMAVLGTSPVGRDPVEIDGPRHLTWNADQARFYAVLSYPFEVVSPHATQFGSSIRAGYVQSLDAADLRPVGEVRAEERAGDLALAADGSQLAVTHFDTLRSLEGETLAERRSDLVLIEQPVGMTSATAPSWRAPACIAPSAIAYGQQSDRAFLVCTGEDSIGVMDTRQGALISLTPSAAPMLNKPFKPWTITLDGPRERLLISNQQVNTVDTFSAEDNPRLLSSARVNGVPFHAAWVGEAEFIVALQRPNGVARVSATDGAVLAEAAYSTAECENPSEPQLLPDGRLFLICEGDHYAVGALAELDPRTLTIVQRVELGLYPERMAVVLP
ncbi:MAG TPA: hypothetical protein VFX15_12705 [Actinomycetes bacterium]|nr:hypothetical protein [Actinomycetes bacterium]